jgi:hypothetical protein
MLRLNQNNLEEYLKKTEAEEIYMKKINSLNMSFTSILTSIQSLVSTYDYQLSTLNNAVNVLNLNTNILNSNTNNLNNSILSVSNSFTNYTSLNNSELASIKIDTLNLYNSLSSLTGGDNYNYMKQLNKVSADTYIDFDINSTIDDIEKFTYNDNINVRVSDINKLSYVIQTNISNTGMTLTQPLDRLGLKLANNVPLSGEVKSLDLVACNDSAGCELPNLVVSQIKFYNSNNGYFKSLNLPEFGGYNFNGYTMNTSDGLYITAANNENNFSNMVNLNFKYSCDNANKKQNFVYLNNCNMSIVNNNKFVIDPYINDSTKYTNTLILESMNNKRFPECTLGNVLINNYNKNFTFYSLYFNATTWTINNYNQDALMFSYCNLRKGKIENFGNNNATVRFNNCSQNFQVIDVINFKNVSVQSCKGYTYYDTHYLNIQGANNFTLNYLTMPSLHIQGTLSNNTNTIKGTFTHLDINMSGNQHKFYLTNYTANDLNLTLNKAACSGLTNQTVNISGNGGELYGDYNSVNSMNITGCVGLNNVKISSLTINLNGLNNLTFQPYNNVNLGNMSFVDSGNIYYKGMLKLDNPFNNVYGLEIGGQNFNDGINDPGVKMLNSGIIQNINYSITSVNMSLSANKVINANWICNCDNVKLINVQGINPLNILFDTNNYMFENICKANVDKNEAFTIWCDSVYSSAWHDLITKSKIKPFTYDVSKNLIYLFY